MTGVAQQLEREPLPISIRAPSPADMGYIRGAWSEGYKDSPSNRRLSWPLYKRHVVPELVERLQRPDTELLAAYLGQDIIGWIAHVPGRRVSTVHWVHTRYRIGERGECLRRRGVMLALLDAARIGSRFVYTHRGAYPRHRAVGENRVTADVPLVRQLASRGVTAAFVPFEEWAR